MKKKKSDSGIALFMVISALALLSVLVAELTYTTQMSSRLAYNSIDNLKAYYLMKSAYKLSLVRLKAYGSTKKFLSDPNNKQFKQMINGSMIDMLWSMPIIFPFVAPPNATAIETDTIKDFMKQSALTGSFTANITAEGTKLNLNNLLIREVDKQKDQAAQKTNPNPDQAPENPAQQPRTARTGTEASGEKQEVDFRQILEPAIQAELDAKRKIDNEFEDTYRNVTAKDIVDAIKFYLVKADQLPALPGFKEILPKNAPFYSLSELHLIPGLDDRLYNLITPLVTVFPTSGLNVNKLGKNGLRALVPELTDEDLDDLITKRDDPELGKRWESADDFWKSIEATSAASSINTSKERLSKSNVKIIFEEDSFKINILATVGQSTRRLEAWIKVEDSSTKKDPKQQQNQNGQTNPFNRTNFAGQNATGQTPTTTEEKSSGINLIYWKSI